MSKTLAQKKASAKWEQKYDDLRIRVKKGMREKIKEHATKNGESINEMINRLIDQEINKY